MAHNADPRWVPGSLGPERAEQRLRDLLHATTSIVERLDLELVLRRIVEAAMTLVGARYGALGVIGVDGGLERFIHVGIDQRTAERIGHLPEGRGLLGAVIAERTAIRLERLSADPRSVGFPAHHPSMDSFLGVPLRVGDAVYGNLYLAESSHGEFSADDQSLVIALAATAGIAIENARLYDDARTREVWNATMADVTAAMLDVTGESALDVIAERVAALLGADLVAVVVPDGDDRFGITHAHGSGAAELRGRVYDAAGSLAARALSSRRAVSVPEHSVAALFDWRPEVGPTVAIPLYAGAEPLGVLTVSRAAGDPPFADADLEMAFAFAAHASISLEVVRAREDRRKAEMIRDRERIARDLHDHVIQRLFGAGLALQGASAAADPSTAAAIESQIDVLDDAIKDIRTIIFALSRDQRQGPKRLRDQLLDVISDVAGAWTPPPRVAFSGALDSMVARDLVDDAAAVLRELLTNVVKHSRATRVQVSASLVDDHLRLVVEDDGVGISEDADKSGLANIAHRARARGGRAIVASAPGSGTRVEWTAPIEGEVAP